MEVRCQFCGKDVSDDPIGRDYRICQRCIDEKYEEAKGKRLADLKKDMRS